MPASAAKKRQTLNEYCVRALETTDPKLTQSFKKQHVPFAKLLAIVSPLAGASLGFALQSGYATKTFQELGLAEKYVSWAWLAGPLSGIIVQPIIGAVSDRCSFPWGRRKPFIAIGLVLLVVSMALFSNADTIGQKHGDPSGFCGIGKCPRGLAVSLVAFWIMDFCLNAIIGPTRTLMVDIVPAEQQHSGNSWFAFMSGLGTILANFLGSFHMSQLVPIFDTDLRALFTLGILIVIISIVPCLIFVQDRPFSGPSEITAESDEDHVYRENVFSRMVRLGRALPPHIVHTFIVQCCTWYAWFCVFMFAANWVGRDVYGGDATAEVGSKARDTYEEGVRTGNLGLALQAVVSMSYSVLLPHLIKRFGMRIMYLISHLVLACSLLSTLLVATYLRGKASGSYMALFLLACMGVSWASTFTIPWSIMGMHLSSSSSHGENSNSQVQEPLLGVSGRPEHGERSGSEGVQMAVMNLSQCFPEIVCSFMAVAIFSILPGSNAAVLASGGVVCGVGAALIMILKIPPDEVLYA
eukprot:CAMPEP_0184341542 /NCGR_PEP_ID=MMETSP1089-20130417/10148_1 /TAXON_ID=38269 ORGANISM="Gloeochaete wittrockiana, Strain SAG46.84" /NCGR_SAMPLE_ID=MMETSP1089 /ASSEMBLY_ACC=CAM_ASM_000445 /LENGTH=524 /DNA_ID=CAMNT_0026669887 /DNA_START=9 /DNA_END=1583 /DNA_ORIENTATION=+